MEQANVSRRDVVAEPGVVRPTAGEWSEVLPPEGHAKLGKELFRIVGEVIEDKQQLGLHEKWKREYKLVRGKHWEKASRVPQKVANFCHVHVMRTVNTLTDNNPTFNISQTGDAEQEDVYSKLQLTAEFWWNETEQQSLLERSVRNGETYGVTVEKMIFNPDVEYGMGDVETVLVDPFHFGVYPVKCVEVQKAEIVLHYYAMSVREARRRWPEFADRIKPDSQYLEDLGAERREIAGGKGMSAAQDGLITRAWDRVTQLLSTSDRDKPEGDEETLVVEAWLKDYTMEGEQPKYRGHIRRITACSAGLLVVDDRSNPSISDALPDDLAIKTYLYDKYPFIVTNSISEANNLWGLSDIEQLDILQGEINKTISQIAYHKDKAVRPKVINPKDSGVPNEHFTNVHGVLNPSSGATAQGIRFLEAQNNMGDMLEVFNLYKELFYQVGGTFDLDQAQSPGKSVIAYKAIAALLERAGTMMRGKIRNYGKLIRERGRMFLSLMMNYYTEDRWISYDEGGETHAMPIRGTAMVVPARMTVVSGSTMPQSKIQQREEALELFKLGAIDQEELLEKIDWSGRAAVIARAKEGPYADLMERMSRMGVDEQAVQLLNQIAHMEREDFDKQLEGGAFPMLGLPAVDPSLTLALQEKEAEVQKIQAEIELIMAKAKTEGTTELVRKAGASYDEDKLDIERTKVLAMLDKQRADQSMREQMAQNPRMSDRLPSQRAKGNPAPGPERGLESNNKSPEPRAPELRQADGLPPRPM